MDDRVNEEFGEAVQFPFTVARHDGLRICKACRSAALECDDWCCAIQCNGGHLDHRQGGCMRCPVCEGCVTKDELNEWLCSQ